MPVLIGGNALRPAPQVEFATAFQTLGDGRLVGSNLTATVRGSILVGVNPPASGTTGVAVATPILSRMTWVLQQQEQITQWFKTPGQWFEVQGWDGAATVRFQGTVEGIEFSPGPWTDRCDYTVTLRAERFADQAITPTDDHIETATENWQIEEAEGPHTYRVTHTLSAKGKTIYDGTGTVSTPAWQYAKRFVENRLGLGWTVSDGLWSPEPGQGIFAESSVLPDSSTPYNRVISETVDELDGTYNATETFFVASTPYWEEYTVQVRKEVNDPWTGNVVTISGTVHGLTTGLHDPEGKYANALAAWQGTIQPTLFSRATTAASPVSLNTRHTAQQVDLNPNEGTIVYSYEFNDRPIVNDTLEFYNISLQTSDEDSKTTVTIEGQIVGLRYPDDPFNPFEPFLKYQRAWAQWLLVKNLMFVRVQAESGVPDLRAFPVSASVNPNKQDGSVGYSFAFDNRIPETVRDEYQVGTSYSRDDGRTLVTVQGTITGLRSANPTQPFQANDLLGRYNQALAYFQAIQPNILGLAARFVDVTKVNPTAYRSQLNHIPNSGQVTYEYEFNSLPVPCIAGAISQNMTFTDDAAVPVIALFPIPGRAAGPIIQDINTVKERRRTVVIEYVVPVNYPTSICHTITQPTFDVSGYAPVGSIVRLEQDQTQWTSLGHASRTVSWIYES